MDSIYEFLSEFKEFLEGEKDSPFWIYSDYNFFGRLLIKEEETYIRTLFTPWDTEYITRMTKVAEAIESFYTFKGHNVDHNVFIGRYFHKKVKRSPKIEPNITLIEVDLERSNIKIYGSMNVSDTLLKSILKFADHNSFEVSYDFEGILRYAGINEGGQQLDRAVRKQKNPTAFFSYSWDSDKHKLWVLKLAGDLIKNGVDVIIDQWDLDKYNDDLNYFMENGIRNSDYVIIVCTPHYAKKANNRKGGVGIENTIITGEFFERTSSGKYLPIVRDYKFSLKKSLPSYLKTKYAIDFKKDSSYKKKFEELLRKLFKKPKFERPELGDIPDLPTERF